MKTKSNVKTRFFTCSLLFARKSKINPFIMISLGKDLKKSLLKTYDIEIKNADNNYWIVKWK